MIYLNLQWTTNVDVHMIDIYNLRKLKSKNCTADIYLRNMIKIQKMEKVNPI